MVVQKTGHQIQKKQCRQTWALDFRIPLITNTQYKALFPMFSEPGIIPGTRPKRKNNHVPDSPASDPKESFPQATEKNEASALWTVAVCTLCHG